MGWARSYAVGSTAREEAATIAYRRPLYRGFLARASRGCTRQVTLAHELEDLLGQDLRALFGQAEGDRLVEQLFERADGQVGHDTRLAVGDDPQRLSLTQAVGQELDYGVVEGGQLAVEGGVHAVGVREQDLGHGPIGEAHADDRSNVGAGLLRHRRCRARDVDAIDRHRERGEEAIHQIREHRTFVLEVEVEGATRDAGLGHDVVDGGRVVAALGEHVARRRQDGRSALGLRRRAPRRLPSPRRRVPASSRFRPRHGAQSIRPVGLRRRW